MIVQKILCIKFNIDQGLGENLLLIRSIVAIGMKSNCDTFNQIAAPAWELM